MNEKTTKNEIKIMVKMPNGENFELVFDEGTSTKEIFESLRNNVFCYITEE